MPIFYFDNKEERLIKLIHKTLEKAKSDLFVERIEIFYNRKGLHCYLNQMA